MAYGRWRVEYRITRCVVEEVEGDPNDVVWWEAVDAAAPAEWDGDGAEVIEDDWQAAHADEAAEIGGALDALQQLGEVLHDPGAYIPFTLHRRLPQLDAEDHNK